MTIIRFATSRLNTAVLFNNESKRQMKIYFKMLSTRSSSTAVPHHDTDKEIFPLPLDRSRANIANQGWITATTVKHSNIPGAGYGRFSDVNVPKNTVIMSKAVIPMAEVSSIHSLANDEIVQFKNKDEIEKFISLYETEGQQSREDLVECLAHFMFTLPNFDGVGLNVTSMSTNHGSPEKGEENIKLLAQDDGKIIIVKTVADVQGGDELLCDYRDYDPMGEFWVQFCKDEGVKDMLTNIKGIVDL